MTRGTPNPDFKVKPLFDVEYLRNRTRHIVTMKYATRDLTHSKVSFLKDLEVE